MNLCFDVELIVMILISLGELMSNVVGVGMNNWRWSWFYNEVVMIWLKLDRYGLGLNGCC